MTAFGVRAKRRGARVDADARGAVLLREVVAPQSLAPMDLLSGSCPRGGTPRD